MISDYFNINTNFILVIDFGSQYSYMIERRLRDIGVSSYLSSYKSKFILDILNNKKLKGIILSGGPYSIYDKEAPLISNIIFSINVPILGICYGMQMISVLFGGIVEQSCCKEYGKSNFEIIHDSPIFHKVPKKSIVWMSHFDEVKKIPKELNILGSTISCHIAAFSHINKKIYSVQFHPEVQNTEFGKLILKNFVCNICECSKIIFRVDHMIKKLIIDIKKRVNSKHVILGFSGGLDSYITAYLLYQAIGNLLLCIFIDTGFFPNREKIRIINLCNKMNWRLKIIDAKNHFLKKLFNISDPEMKRKIIGKEFIYYFQKELKIIQNNKKDIVFFAQGTIYSDVVESSSNIKEKNREFIIKSHHNVGGIPKNIKSKLKLIEPLKYLFKDEVRSIGKKLGFTKDILYHHPYPGPGLSIRIIGKISKKKIYILKHAEDILFQELINFDIYYSVNQAFIVLLPIKSVGVMGDKRSYSYVAVVRVIQTDDFMTAQFAHLSYKFLESVSNRITNEVHGINRILYDISSKPPSTIEWE